MLVQLAAFLMLLTGGGEALAIQEKRLDNGLGRTPALGWNSWNQGACEAATAATVLKTAQAFEDLGLKALGYTYLNIDDCWSQKQRNSQGYLQADPVKFPNGIDGLARQVHSMGFKLGLYGDAGTQTCGGYPGSYQSEQKDAKTLAAWGVDYWKYDNCQTEGPYTNQGIDSSHYYPIMRDALLKTDRPILFSMCQWGRDHVWTWAAQVGNSWRMSPDIQNNWASMASIAAKAATLHSYAAPGGFNDLDMMVKGSTPTLPRKKPTADHTPRKELGNGVLTEAEERAHFGLWAIMKSPIILGTDMTKIPTSTLNIIKNKNILAIHQDRLGKAATTFRPTGQPAPSDTALYPYFAGPLSDGVVLGLVAANGAATLTVNFADVPGLGAGQYSWTELYSGRTGSGMSVSWDLASHDMAILKVVKTS